MGATVHQLEEPPYHEEQHSGRFGAGHGPVAIGDGRGAGRRQREVLRHRRRRQERLPDRDPFLRRQVPDAAGDAWIYVPKGTCDKINGGSLEPKA